MIYAAGIAAATGMLGTLAADYPANRSRGKLIALGARSMASASFLYRRPRRPDEGLCRPGLGPVMAGHTPTSLVAALCLLSAVIIAIGVRKGTPAPRDQRPLGELVRSALAEARNPRIALAYACAFIARGDLVVLGTFSMLWGTTAAMNDGHESRQKPSADGPA